MRLAVTGASGMVGSQVVLAAIEAGHEARAVVHQERGPTCLEGVVEQVAADVGDLAALSSAMRGMEGVVHCAAVYAFGEQRAQEVARVSTSGTRNVIEAAARAGVGRVTVTSSAVTRGSSTTAMVRDESAQLGDEPAPGYYLSKVAQEEAALESGRRHGVQVVLALPTVVLGGPFTRLAPSNAIVLRYLLDPTRSTFRGGCNVIDARDVGRGHVVLLERGVPGERYILGGQDVTWRLLHTLVAELAGLPGPYAELPAPAAWLGAAAAEGWARLRGAAPLTTREEATTVGRYYWYSSARAEELGHVARPAREAVAASLAWLAISPDLPRWVREGLRLRPEVRAARTLVPLPLPERGTAPPAEVDRPAGGVSAPRRRSRPGFPRRPR